MNPYAPPDCSTGVVDSALDARRRLARPATALIVMSSIQSILLAIPLVSGVIQMQNGTAHNDAALLSAINIFQIAALVTISVCSAKMEHLKSYPLARIGAILACVPIVTPFILAGIPFGVWSLLLLTDPKIRSEFPAQHRHRG